jgi:LysM repeat protein
MPRSRLLALLMCVLLAAVTSNARAFTYVVQPGDTLASIAERFYGQIQHEKLLVAANALDAEGGSPIVPGMRLEVPALSYHRVQKNETWNGLAQDLLGAEHRSIVLSTINDSSPWLTPEEGAQIVVPYNLRVIVKSNEATPALAYKYLGDMNKAWELDHYNSLDGRALQRGDVVLIPITDLALTKEGRDTAAHAARVRCSEGAGETRETQLRVRTELPALISDVKSGRYAEAVRRGSRFLASGELSKQTLATVHRQLLEAYVALDATGLATGACAQWRANDTKARLDPILLSPKIIAACERGATTEAK